MGLFKPAWLGNNEDKALKAVYRAEKKNDQKRLMTIYEQCKNDSVRKQAVLFITDADLLNRIILNDNRPYIVDAVLPKITDKAVLAKVAAKLKNEREKLLNSAMVYDSQHYLSTKYLTAIKELANDEAAIIHIACNSLIPKAQIAAIEILTNQDILTRIATEGRWLNVRNAALEKITDKELQLQILNDPRRKKLDEEANEYSTEHARYFANH